MQTYTIWAYSPSLNQSHRQLQLASLNTPVTDLALAQRDADAFAHQFNQQRKQHKTDWVGKVKLEEVGITSIPGYLFHTGR